MTSGREANEPYAAALETHSAAVYFVGDRTYKLKKPVKTDFLDFTTVGARTEACRRETELNRRFAPDVYLGVGELRALPTDPAEPLVVMRRMPAGRRLASLLQAGRPVGEPLRQVARQLAVQHAAAQRGSAITRQGGRDALLGRWRDNLAEIRQLAGAASCELDVTDIERLAERFLAGREPLLADRMQAGRIIDGHGDLLAEDIFCLDDGPKILDCLEFDDRLRWLDGLDDASFLAMDLDRLGRPDLAEQFVDWYAEFTADPAPASLRHHYVAYRAMVRAKVGCIRAAQQRQAMGSTAQLADLALRHLRAAAVTLVLVGGLPGTGKTVLSGQIAGRLGCVVLGSDTVRKELAGLQPRQHAAAPYNAGLYSPAWTNHTYQELLSRAARLLARGESVVLDASWTSAGHRTSAEKLAYEVSADLVQLRCDIPADLAARRLQARIGDASDAGPEVAEHLRADAEPWPDATVIDTSEPGGGQITSLQRALDAIRPYGAEHAWHAARPYMLPD
ncbi:MAG TPA: AAA family ATPase [Streptosporangiaceae bacterium]|nr:AAA family ATPase [Streptosporangiaceae bacterium]